MLKLWLLLAFLPCYQFLQCLNENNEAVDWFIVYKFPDVFERSAGLNYNFLTSNNYDNWKLSKIHINDSQSIIGQTLRPLFNKTQDDLVYVAYNDQPPNSSSNPNKGHTKGVVASNETSGFWLIHSVPHFPDLTQTAYSFPENGLVYGQTFLCITLNLSTINRIGLQLQYNEPQIISHTFPEIFNDKLPILLDLIGGKTVKTPPWYRRDSFKSRGNFEFVSFAKSRKFNKDLYEDWLAPDLQSDLLVESWRNGPGKLPSNCTKPFKVFNIEAINIETVVLDFKSTHDHSKWAVTINPNLPNWICIGDINRMVHQKLRGGGTVCLQNKILQILFRELVTSIEKCTN